MKRYTPNTNWNREYLGMEEDTEGEWVKYADYAEAITILETALKVISVWSNEDIILCREDLLSEVAHIHEAAVTALRKARGGK